METIINLITKAIILIIATGASVAIFAVYKLLNGATVAEVFTTLSNIAMGAAALVAIGTYAFVRKYGH
jgi:hypothetical protein